MGKKRGVEMSHAGTERPRGLDVTHRPQTGDLVVCWAFVPHYYQPVIHQAHEQLYIPSEDSSLSSLFGLPPHTLTTIQLD